MAWLADLVADYVLKNTQQHFKIMKHFGIYRDDGICVTKEIMTKNETIKWLNDFQMSVNTLIEGNYLKFTASIWNVEESSSKLTDKIDTVGDNAFPYLDMEFFWSNNELHTKVHIKQNQRLSYLEKCSTHPSTVFKAIPRGVFKRLAKLTTKTPENANTLLDQLYPQHAKTLKSANLNPPKYPSINEVNEETELK